MHGSRRQRGGHLSGPWFGAAIVFTALFIANLILW